MNLLVIDVGSTGVRAAVVREDGAMVAEHYRRTPPATPLPGFVELDPVGLAQAAVDLARQSLLEAGPVAGLGITNQRASTVVWDRKTGVPLGPGLSWQDLRTTGMCLALAEKGIRLAPNQSATKASALLDIFDPKRSLDVCFGTIDSWIAWNLSGGTVHVTDVSNAALTGLLHPDASGWSVEMAQALRIPLSALPTLVDSSGCCGNASQLPGAPPICALIGDQQASLIGQGCTRPGLAKATFGTAGILDVCLGSDRPAYSRRGDAGTYPVVAWRRGGSISWGAEAIMLSAGSAVDYFCEELGLVATPAETEIVANLAGAAADVWFVPSLSGMGTPVWDFGARGLMLGLTRDTTKEQMVRSVLEGIAHRGADLVEASEADTGLRFESLRIDGGMSANRYFVQALADAAARTIEVSPVLEATALGAAYLAGLAVGVWSGEDEIASLWSPRTVIEPRRQLDRQRWLAARERARAVVPELSALEF